MHRIEKNNLGFKLTFGGAMNKEEMEAWYKEAEQSLQGAKGPFGVIVDMRTLEPLSPDVQATMVKGQGLFRAKGLQRSAVILNNPLVTVQFMRLAKESGIYAYERYLDASSDSHWQKHAEDWVKSGVDPDLLSISAQKAGSGH